MSPFSLNGLTESRDALEALPVGVAIYDGERRLVLANRMLLSPLGAGPEAFRPGSRMEEHLRIAARRGMFGSGDPEAQVAEMLALDAGRAHRFQRRLADGRTFESHYRPLPAGHVVVCLIETSARGKAAERERAGTRLEAALRGLRMGVAVFGAQGSLALVNPSFGRLMGVEAGALAPGMGLEAVLRAVAAGDAEGEAFVAGQLAVDRGRPDNFRRERGDGTVLDVASDPLPDGGWLLTATDATPLSRAEDEARRREELAAGIVASVPHGVSVYGPDRELRMVNAAYGEIMEGAPVAVGETMDQIIERRAKSGEYGEGEVAEGGEQRGPGGGKGHRRRRPTGRTIDVTTSPLPDGGHVSVVTDMTAVVEAEAELSRRMGEMQAMLAHIRHGVVLWGADRRVVTANAVASEMVGAGPEHFAPGRTLDDVVAAALARGNLGEGRLAESRAQWLLQQDRGFKHYDQRLTRDGRLLEVRSDPIPGGGFVTTYTDVTQARDAEDALRLSKSAAEAANAAKSRFLAAMSGELRTPLATIRLELGRLGRAADAGVRRGGAAGLAAEEMREACAAAGEAAERLTGLIEAVLDVARLESGRVELSEAEIEVVDLVRACLRKADSAAAAAEVALVVDLPEGLPRVRCDTARMNQVLGHVVGNAIRFTPAMGSVSIAARHDWTTGDLMLSVEDTGCGMTEAELARVFEPFARAGEGTRAGLGLHISRMVMRAHGGDLVLRSRPGEGTAALLRLPGARVAGGKNAT